MSGGLGRISGDGAAKGVFRLVEIAELTIDNRSVDERRGNAGTKNGGTLILGGSLVEFPAIGMEVPEIEMLAEIVLTGVERGDVFLRSGLHRRKKRRVDGSGWNDAESGGGANADEARVVLGGLGDEIDGVCVEPLREAIDGRSADDWGRILDGGFECVEFTRVGAGEEQTDERGGENGVVDRIFDVGEHPGELRPVVLASGVNESSLSEDGSLVVIFVPLADELVGPLGVFVFVAKVAGIG